MSITLNDLQPHLENVREYSGYLACTCPFHQDSKPSLMVYSDHYYCAACGAHGSLEFLMAKVQGGYFAPPGQIIMPNWSKWLSDIDLRTFSKQAHNCLKRHVEYQLYLRKRGVDSMIDDMRLGFYDGYYIFPVFDENGKVLNLIARAGETLQEATGNRYFSCPSTYSEMRGTIYTSSFEELETSPYIVVVFGIFDLLSLGALNVPSITFTNGKNLPAHLVDQYRKIFYIIGDKGEEKEAKKVACSLGWRGRFVSLTYPDGCKDINDVHMKYGKDKVLQIIGKILQQDQHKFALEII